MSRRPGFGVSLAALGTTVALLLLGALVVIVAGRGLGHFWPEPVGAYLTSDGQRVYGTVLRRFEDGEAWLLQVSAGTGEALPLARVEAAANADAPRPEDLAVFRRARGFPVYGRLLAVEDASRPSATALEPWRDLELRLERSRRLRAEITELERGRLARVNAELRSVDRSLRRAAALPTEERVLLEQRRRLLLDSFEDVSLRLQVLRGRARTEQVLLADAEDRRFRVPVAEILGAYRPNAMGPLASLGHFLGEFRRFVTEPPRQSNLQGGVLPALFGTVLLVLLMALLVAPLGVLVALFLSEYAGESWLTRLVRAAISNLAAVPSVVYGVFGLAFFVYTIGGSADRLLFAERLPAPTFGTGGLLWASLTLALLTLPVVIVATEEALARVPASIRQASSALGATRFETIRHTVLPMAAPGLLTGLILAMARAAGEVAPLMLVGVVKVAPGMPVDGEFPWLHLERKFMHLGFHIYDLALQSPSLAIAESTVYATALLLLGVIVALNVTAVGVRNRLRERLKALEAGAAR